MHTQSFTNPQFLKIGLTHKKVPSGVANCRNVPFCGRARRGSRVRFPKEERCAESPPTFICGKRRKNRRKLVKMKILISGVILRLRKVLAPLTFVSKDNNLFLELWKLCYLNFYFFLFLRSTKVGLLLLRTLHQRGNQTYVVLS